jgi:COP9 signalosome complex subunit 3
VCKVLKSEAMQLNAPIRGIAPLRAAVRKVQASSEHLTPLHAEYLTLCLLAKQYKAGLSVLEDDIFEVDQPKDLFLYCYYGYGGLSLMCGLYYGFYLSKYARLAY